MAISLLLTTRADRIGRRRMLIVGAVLMAGAGVAFASTKNYTLPESSREPSVVISPSGNEVGPFLSIEQAALSHVVPARSRTKYSRGTRLRVLSATPLGAFCGAQLRSCAEGVGFPRPTATVVVLLYAVWHRACVSLTRLVALSGGRYVRDAAVECPQEIFSVLGRSRSIVLKLSSLFAAGLPSAAVCGAKFRGIWFYLRFGVPPVKLGLIFFWANVLAGISALLASRLATRIGLVRTMVVTHLPSNVLLILCRLCRTSVSRAGAARPIQHQPDGRADETVLYDGRGAA